MHALMARDDEDGLDEPYLLILYVIMQSLLQVIHNKSL